MKGRYKAMAEVTKKKISETSTQIDVPEAPSPEGLVARKEYLLASFNQREIAGLLRVKRAADQGRYSETTQEHKRLMFARWLVEDGRLDG